MFIRDTYYFTGDNCQNTIQFPHKFLFELERQDLFVHISVSFNYAGKR